MTSPDPTAPLDLDSIRAEYDQLRPESGELADNIPPLLSALAAARVELAEAKRDLKREAQRARMASQHARKCDAQVADADAEVARLKSWLADANARWLRHQADDHPVDEPRATGGLITDPPPFDDGPAALVVPAATPQADPIADDDTRCHLMERESRDRDLVHSRKCWCQDDVAAVPGVGEQAATTCGHQYWGGLRQPGDRPILCTLPPHTVGDHAEPETHSSWSPEPGQWGNVATGDPKAALPTSGQA